jgi:hypothetical protein
MPEKAKQEYNTENLKDYQYRCQEKSLFFLASVLVIF